jgi:peroxiredoxin
MEDYELIILGQGSAAFAAAIKADEMGTRTAICPSLRRRAAYRRQYEGVPFANHAVAKARRESMKSNGRLSILKPGSKAPNFSLKSTPDQSVSLRDFRGRPVVLAFYPADWSPVCSDEMALYAQVMPEFKKFDAEVLGISVDGIWCHLAFSKDRKLNFPLLSDFEPKGTISRAYGVYEERIGESARALFVIDQKGIIRWSLLSPDGVNPGADGILSALEKLKGT